MKTKFTVTETISYTFDTGDIRPEFFAAAFKDDVFLGDGWHFQDFARAVVESHNIEWENLPDSQLQLEGFEEATDLGILWDKEDEVCV